MIDCLFGAPAFSPGPQVSHDPLSRPRFSVLSCGHATLSGGVQRGLCWANAECSLLPHGQAPALLEGTGLGRQPSCGEKPGSAALPAVRAAGRPGAASSLPEAPLSQAAAWRLRVAALGPANQTRAFPAGVDQSAASVLWKRETLRGKAITKAFHCRQMLSVCADFSCF